MSFLNKMSKDIALSYLFPHPFPVLGRSQRLCPTHACLKSSLMEALHKWPPPTLKSECMNHMMLQLGPIVLHDEWTLALK